MSLAAGVRLGVYEVLAPLGAGGMGEVYRARDTRLGREVAIKVLPASLAGDPDRLMRFEREAKTLAALNHPTSRRSTASEEAGGSPRPGHGARGGRGSGGAHRKRAAAARRGAADRAANRRGARGRARRRHRAPRPEARQHQGAAGRHREGAGLRAGEGARQRLGGPEGPPLRSWARPTPSPRQR